MSNRLTRSATAALLAGALVPGTAAAASFQILEQSPALQGTSFAGTASSAQDASTVFFNPAAMGQLDGAAFMVGGSIIHPKAEFNDDGSTNSTGSLQPGGAPLQGTEDTTEETALVPSVYYVRPLNDRWTFGLGVNAPFGLTSSYDKDWLGRYHATDSQLELLNVNPTFSYRVSDVVSLGFGLNYQRVDATLERQVDSYSACLAAGGAPATCDAQHGGPGNPDSDSSAKIEGDDDDVTVDLSLLVTLSDRTNIGATYRQGGNFSLDGNANFQKDDSCQPTGPTDPAAFCSGALDNQAGAIEADLEIPDVLTFSASHMLNDRWTLHGDVSWTEWSSIQEIEIDKADGSGNVSTLDLEYDDTMRYAAGATYSDGGPWTWRGGIAFDEAPQTDPEFQTPRVPDEDRTWFSFGFNYALSQDSSIDFGYTYIDVDTVNINNTTDDGKTLDGTFDASVNILAVSGNWRF